MSENTDLADILLNIYDTAIQPQHWPEVLDKIAHFVGARGAFIFELEVDGIEQRIQASQYSSAYVPEIVAGYMSRHNNQELIDQEIFARLSRKADTIRLICDDVLAKSEEELVGRANVQEMMRNGLRYRAGALLNKDQINHDRFALQFSRSQGPITDEHVRKAELILPHMAKVLNVARPTSQLANQYRSVADVLDKLLVGICVLDANGCIALSNREFQRQMDWHTVFRRDGSGRLVMRSDQAQSALSELRKDVANHGRFGARPRKEAIISDVGGEPHTLCVEVVPLNSAEELGEKQLRGHIIYSMDTSSSYAINSDILKSLFSLTQAEAAILELMAEGLTNPQISERRSKSQETINSQVKSILIKTGTANRTQVIRLATNISSSFILDSHHPNG